MAAGMFQAHLSVSDGHLESSPEATTRWALPPRMVVDATSAYSRSASTPLLFTEDCCASGTLVPAPRLESPVSLSLGGWACKGHDRCIVQESVGI